MKPDRKTRISLIEDVRELLNLSAQEKALLFIYASYANPDGWSAYPGRELLSTLMNLSTKQVERYIDSLEKKGYLIKVGKTSYMDRYRVNVPDHRLKSSIPAAAPGADISQEEWESQFLPEEEDEDATVKLPIVKPPVEDATVKVPVVKPPPGPTAEEKLQKDIKLLHEALNLTKRGIMTYEVFMRGGKRKGFSDDYLNWMFNGGGGEEEGDSSLPSSQHGNESPAAISSPENKT